MVDDHEHTWVSQCCGIENSEPDSGGICPKCNEPTGFECETCEAE